MSVSPAGIELLLKLRRLPDWKLRSGDFHGQTMLALLRRHLIDRTKLGYIRITDQGRARLFRIADMDSVQ